MACPAAVLIASAALAGLQGCASAGGPGRVTDPVPVSAQALVPLAEMRELARDTPWVCTNYDEASRTCEAVRRTEWRDPDHGTARTTMLAREMPRVVLALTLPVRVEGDLECGPVAELTVDLFFDRAVPRDLGDYVRAETRRKLAKKAPFIC